MRLSRQSLYAVAAVAGLGVVPAAAVPLVQHRAVYDLALERASDRSGISSITGRMVYEIRGSACEGYTVRFRYVTQSDTRENSQVTDQQTTTFEDAGGTSFNFVTKSYVDENLDKELRGNATLAEDGLKVALQAPERKEVELGKAMFPTRHLVDLIDKANRGETFYEATIFDGSDDADKNMTTTVIVGKPAAPAASDPEVKALDDMADDKFWPVDIAYFDETSKGGEDTPEYRISFKLYENGLTRDLEMDYGDFAIRGKLVDLALFEVDKSTCTP